MAKKESKIIIDPYTFIANLAKQTEFFSSASDFCLKSLSLAQNAEIYPVIAYFLKEYHRKLKGLGWVSMNRNVCHIFSFFEVLGGTDRFECF